MRCGRADGSWEYQVFNFGSCVSEICIFVFSFDAIFCGTNFFIFEDSVWLVKSSGCVHCYFIRQIYWVGEGAEANLSCGDFLFEKKLSSQYWQFFFLFGLDCQTLFEFSQI